MNTKMEMLGNLIDKLSIINIRMWMLEDIKRDPNRSDKEIADATKQTNIINIQRCEIVEEINDLIIKLLSGEIKPKNYMEGSTKNYGKNKS